MSDIINEPIIWVCVTVFTFLTCCIIRFSCCDIVENNSDNKSDCTADISENSSEENV